jgi:hypothetical protein
VSVSDVRCNSKKNNKNALKKIKKVKTKSSESLICVARPNEQRSPGSESRKKWATRADSTHSDRAGATEAAKWLARH